MLAEAEADDAGVAELEIPLPGMPLYVAGDGFQGPVARRSSAPGEWTGRKEDGGANASARQWSTANVSEHARADEDPNVRSTRVKRASDSRDAKRVSDDDPSPIGDSRAADDAVPPAA